jgi:hypothetical protein
MTNERKQAKRALAKLEEEIAVGRSRLADVDRALSELPGMREQLVLEHAAGEIAAADLRSRLAER